MSGLRYWKKNNQTSTILIDNGKQSAELEPYSSVLSYLDIGEI